LAAILAADGAGYSRLMGDDERPTVAAPNAVCDEFGISYGQLPVPACLWEHDGAIQSEIAAHLGIEWNDTVLLYAVAAKPTGGKLRCG
jgi:hypothetical protein